MSRVCSDIDGQKNKQQDIKRIMTGKLKNDTVNN